MNMFPHKKIKVLFIVGLTFVTLTMVFVSGFYFQHEKKNIKSDAFDKLKSITQIKIKTLVQWQTERQSEASFFSSNIPYPTLIKQIIDGNKNAEEQYKNTLLRIMTNRRFVNIALIDRNGKMVFSVYPQFGVIDSATIQHSAKAIKTGQIRIREMYYSREHKQVHQEFIAPVKDDDGNAFASLVFTSDPEQFIFAVISEWPLQSLTAEAYLVVKDNDSVLFMNRLRNSNYLPLSHRIALSENENTAVRAVSGKRGELEGIDYRNKKVLSYIESVPETNWLLLSEIDQKEVYSELNRRFVLIGILFFILMLLFGFGALLTFYQRQRNVYKKLYQSKEKLHQTKEEFKSILYSIGEGIITTDVLGKVIQMNPMAEKLCGRQEFESKGLHINEVMVLLSEEKNKAFDSLLEQVLNEEEIVDLTNQVYLLAKDGRKLPLAVNAAPVKNKNGEKIGVIVVFKDRTRIWEQQKAIIESEEKFKLLLNSTAEGIYGIDLNGNCTFINRAALRMLNYESDKEVLGKNMHALVHHSRIDGSLLKIEECNIYNAHKKAEGVHVEDECFWRKDGSFFWTEYWSYPIIENNRAIGAVVAFFDITDRTELLEELKESEKIKRSYFEYAPYGLFVTNRQGNYVEVNSMAIQMSGYSEKELLKMSIVNLIAPESGKEGKLHFESVLNEGFAQGDFQFVKKNGEIRWWSVVAKKLSEHRFIAFCEDITEHKQVLDTLKSNYQLLQIAGEVTKFGGWSVDLNENRVHWSNQVAEIHEMPLGFSPTVEQGIDFYADEWKPVITDRYNRCVKAGIPYDEEFEIIASSGKRKWVRTIGRPKMNEKGEVVRIEGAFQDISSLKAAQRELNESRMVLSRLIGNLSGIAYRSRLDRDWTMEFISKGCEKLTGYPDKDFYSGKMTWNKLILEEERELVYQRIISSIKVDQSFQLEYRIMHKNGEIRWFWEKGLSVCDEKNKVIALEGFVMDITERKLANEELRKSEQKFKDLIESAPVGIVLTDADENILFINKRFVELTGYVLEDQSTLKDWWSLAYPDEHLQKETEKLWALSKKEEPESGKEMTSLESKIRCKDQTEKYMEIGYVNTGDLIIITFVDITTRKMAEIAARKSAEEFRTLIHNAPQGIFVQTKECFAYLNPTALKLFGLTDEEKILGQSVIERFHPDFRKRVQTQINILNSDLKEVSSVEVVCLKTDGSAFDVEVSAVPINYQGVNGALVFFNDISDRKRAENELLILKENLEIRVKEKTTELNARIQELERFHEATIDRELRMKELKDELERLRKGS